MYDLDLNLYIYLAKCVASIFAQLLVVKSLAWQIMKLTKPASSFLFFFRFFKWLYGPWTTSDEMDDRDYRPSDLQEYGRAYMHDNAAIYSVLLYVE